MKQVALIIFIALSFQISAQTEYTHNWKRVAVGASFTFTAGLANGFGEAISHHPNAVKSRFPNWPEQKWNPEYTWRNKYKDGIPENGPAFWGSTSVFIWATDPYHAKNYVRTGGLVLGTFVLTVGEKKPLKFVLLDMLVGAGAYYAGNYLTYNVIFRD